METVKMLGQWTVFFGVDTENRKFEKFTTVPEEVDGIRGKRIEFDNNVWTSESISTEPESALFFCEFNCSADEILSFGTGACYFFQIFLNGSLLIDKRECGNKPYPIPPAADNFITAGKVKRGKNLLIATVKSIGGEPLSLACSIVDSISGSEITPSVENFKNLIDSADFPSEESSGRKTAHHLIQNGVLMMRNTIFTPYSAGNITDPAEINELQQKYPILYFYEKALDRIISEIPNTTPAANEVIMWHLYNMGYVIKTPTTTFGIDINHRRAVELEPYLDFILTTHNHIDHYTLELLRAMTANQKQVVSNFHPAPGFHRPPAELELNGIKISTQENDHNPILKKFVTAYLIRIGNGCTIYATGDSRDVSQLTPQGEVDIFIPHPRVGLSVPAAVEKFHPASVLYSHMFEMRHTPPIQPSCYAVPYTLLDAERKSVEETGTAALAPLWGEKLIWHTGMRRFI